MRVPAHSVDRSRRQTAQLIGVALVAVVLLAAYLLTRSGAGPSATADTGVTRSGSTAPGTRQATDPVSGLRWVDESALPSQAHDTLALIRAGGPYPYPRNDDKTFTNAEGRLPHEKGGYYREYTVITPGSPDRGARRIIVGAGGEMYYTADHYASFQRIREGR